MTKQDVSEENAEAAMDQAAAGLRSQMSESMAALQPRLNALANFAAARLVPRPAEPSGASPQDTTPVP